MPYSISSREDSGCTEFKVDSSEQRIQFHTGLSRKQGAELTWCYSLSPNGEAFGEAFDLTHASGFANVGKICNNLITREDLGCFSQIAIHSK